MARTCQGRSKLRNVSRIWPLSFRTLWLWTVVTSVPGVGKAHPHAKLSVGQVSCPVRKTLADNAESRHIKIGKASTLQGNLTRGKMSRPGFQDGNPGL